MNRSPVCINFDALFNYRSLMLSYLSRFKHVFFGFLLVSVGVVAQAPLDVRVALIIGNSAYINAPPLINSSNDARAMSNIMRKLGFKVFDVIDGDKRSMDQAVEKMQAQLAGQQAVAMLYYAGHGLQLDWHNYMVPIDAKLNKAGDVSIQTVDIERVINAFKVAKTRMNIVVLDACRDNPFSGQSTGKGLAQMDAPSGTYLAFATAPGNVAEDGDSESSNGLFTQFLIKELQKPAKIEDVFKRVRLQVRQKSQGRQIPWDSSSLEDDFSFNDGAKHTINPEDLIREAREAKEKEQQLKLDSVLAKQLEIQLTKERELERTRLAFVQKQRELEAQTQRLRELEIVKQREIEQQILAEAQKIQKLEVRQKTQAEARERDRLLSIEAESQRAKTQEAELARQSADLLSKNREKQMALAADEARKKSAMADQALQVAKQLEVQRLKDLEFAKNLATEETKNKNESAQKQFEIQKAEWDTLKGSKNVNDFYVFLNKYPSGFIAEQAVVEIEKLDATKITIQPDKFKISQNLRSERFHVGDKYDYVRKDNLTGKELSRFSRVVVKIENGLVYISNGERDEIMTLEGGKVLVASNTTSYAYDPPKLEVPGDYLVVGKKWRGAYVETDQNTKKRFFREDKFQILGQEEISVPAGKFVTFKIEDVSYNQFGTKGSLVYWVMPGYGLPIRTDRLVFNAKAGININETVEITAVRKI